jgi:hypothetical protein
MDLVFQSGEYLKPVGAVDAGKDGDVNTSKSTSGFNNVRAWATLLWSFTAN